jgi:glycosyltransferase involved in cell wall biosynthesis
MEMMLLSSAEEWSRAGYVCDVLASGKTIGPLASQMFAAGFGVFHIPLFGKCRCIPRIRFLTNFYRLCKSGYDVIHIHTETAVPVFAITAWLAGVRRLALTPHNTFYFKGFLRIRKIIERRLIRLIGGRYGMISDGVRKCEWETFRNPGIRTWNWIDTMTFRPATFEEKETARKIIGCNPKQFVLVSVGNCNDAKNHTEILRALLYLSQSVDVLYLHVGKEQDDCSERKLAEDIGVQHMVRFCGSQSDTRKYLWAADAFVMPSQQEGLSIAAIEAIACATSTVFSNIPGLSEIVLHCESTVLTSTTAETIAAGVLQLVRTPAEVRARRALLDSMRIRHKFSVEHGVRSITDGLYNQDKMIFALPRPGAIN